jgi:hypothetical protein
MSSRTIFKAKRRSQSSAPVADEPVFQAPAVENPIPEAPAVENPIPEEHAVENPIPEVPVWNFSSIPQAPMVETPIPEASLHLLVDFDGHLESLPRKVLEFVNCKKCSPFPSIVVGKVDIDECGHSGRSMFYLCSICDGESKSRTCMAKHVRKCRNPSVLHHPDLSSDRIPKIVIYEGDYSEEQASDFIQWKQRRTLLDTSKNPME